MADSVKIDYSYDGVPTLRRFNASDAFMRGVVGPFGSGKSSACITEFWTRAKEQAPGPDGMRRTRWAVIRNSYRELSDSTIKSVHQWMPPYAFGQWKEQEKRFIVRAIEGCEFEILFRALDRPDDIKKLLSMDLTGAWVNEAREIPWAIIDALQGRLGRYPPRNVVPPTWFGMWLDTNPPDVDSEWFKFFEEGRWRQSFNDMRKGGIFPVDMAPEEFVSIFRQPSGRSRHAENIANLPPGYYHKLAVGKSPEWIKVYIDGEYGFVSNDKPVYPEFRDVLHIKDLDPIDGRPIIRSWDFGLTPACVFSQLLADGRWLVFDEMQATNMGIDRFTDEVIERCSRVFRGRVTFEDYGDPAGNQRAQTDERTCFEIMRAKGILIEGAEQNLALRLESVRKPMRTLADDGEGMQFVLHSRCKILRKGFLGGYHYRRLSTTSERYSEQPEKTYYSHTHDALQYAATILFGGGLTRYRGEYDDYPDPSLEVDERGRSAVTGY